MDVVELANAIEVELAAEDSDDRALKERTYLRSELRHLGASVPAIRAVVKRRAAVQPDLDRDEVVALAEALWAVPVHERRMAAVELLALRGDVLTPADLPLLERLVRESRTWALIDGLAANVVGSLRERFPVELEPILDRWSQDDDHWVRRTSLLAYLVELRRGEG